MTASFFRTMTCAFMLPVLASACTPSTPAIECRDDIGCVQISTGEPLAIGVLQALSGKVAPLGLEQLRGFQLAIDKREGALLNHPITLQIEDTGCTAEGGGPTQP